MFFVREEPINIDTFNKTLAMDEGINPYNYSKDIEQNISQSDFNRKINKT